MQPGRLARSSKVAGALLLAGGAAAIALGLALQPPVPAPVASAPRGPVPTATATSSATPSPSPTARPSGAADPAPTAMPTPGAVGAVLSRSEPIGLDIPAIDVRTEVFPIGLNPDGTIAVPEPGPRYSLAAWYRYSPTPGQLGPSVIEGHLDTPSGEPSVFYRLGELAPGHEIRIDRADGVTAVFRVTAVQSFPKSEFPTSAVYGDLDYAGLRLITCGGGLDSVTRHYLENTVVFATFTSSHPTVHSVTHPPTGDAP